MAKTKRQLLIEFLQTSRISVQEAMLLLVDLQKGQPIPAKGEDRLKAVIGKYENRKQ